MENDRETEKVITAGEKLRLFTESDGWREVKGRLEAKLAALGSIESLPLGDMDYEKIGKEMKDRLGAISLVRDWIGEVEGEVNRYMQNKEILGQEVKEGFVKMFE